MAKCIICDGRLTGPTRVFVKDSAGQEWWAEAHPRRCMTAVAERLPQLLSDGVMHKVPPSIHVIEKNGGWYCQCCAVTVPFDHICSCEGGPDDDDEDDDGCPFCDGYSEGCVWCEGTGFAGLLR